MIKEGTSAAYSLKKAVAKNAARFIAYMAINAALLFIAWNYGAITLIETGCEMSVSAACLISAFLTVCSFEFSK